MATLWITGTLYVALMLDDASMRADLGARVLETKRVGRSARALIELADIGKLARRCEWIAYVQDDCPRAWRRAAVNALRAIDRGRKA